MAANVLQLVGDDEPQALGALPLKDLRMQAKSRTASKTQVSPVHEPSKPKIEDFANLSVENLFGFLRFQAFKQVSDMEKQALFIDAANTPLRELVVFKAIVSAVNDNNFEEMKRIVRENKIDTEKVVKEMYGPDVKPINSWPIMMDCYFKETDEYLAHSLLRYLMFFDVLDEDMAALKLFTAHYLSCAKETRARLVANQILHNSFTI